MRNISGQYKDLLEGKMNKHQFLRNARMMFPNFVSNQNSFEDSVIILKQRGMLVEVEAVKGVPDKAPDYNPPTPDVKTKYKKVEQSPEIAEQDGIYPATTLTDIPKVKANKKVKNTSDGLEEIKDNDTKNELKKVKVLNENQETVDKTTRFDVTLKNGKHFSGVKFINKNSFNTPNGGSYINQEIVKVVPTDEKLREGGNLGHNELSSIHPEGAYWIVTYRGPKGTTEKSFTSEEEAIKFQNGLDDLSRGAGDALRTENEDILGDIGKSISDFDIIEDIELTPNFSLSIVFVDGYYKALIVNNNDNTVVKTFKEARNEHNLYSMLKQAGVNINHTFPNEDDEDDESLNEDKFDDIVKRSLETDDFTELKAFAKEKADIVKTKIKSMPGGLRQKLAKHFNIDLKEKIQPNNSLQEKLDKVITNLIKEVIAEKKNKK
jgi:hypothetical protein